MHISALIVITTVDGVVVVSFLIAPAHLVIETNPLAVNAVAVVIPQPVWCVPAVAAAALDLQRASWDLPLTLELPGSSFSSLATAVWEPCPRL